MNDFFTKYLSKFLFSGLCEALLLEGQYASYNADKLIDTLSKHFRGRLDIESTVRLPRELTITKYGIVFSFSINIKRPTSTDYDFLDKTLNLFGYYLSKKTNKLTTVDIQIEPRHPSKINNILNRDSIKRFYHITHISNMPKIKRIGLAPRGTETTFYHPDDRIYLFSTNKDSVLRSFKKILSRDKGLPIEEFKILYVPVSDKYTYFLDDTATNLKHDALACFVLQNIPPEEIYDHETGDKIRE